MSDTFCLAPWTAIEGVEDLMLSDRFLGEKTTQVSSGGWQLFDVVFFELNQKTCPPTLVDPISSWLVRLDQPRLEQ